MARNDLLVALVRAGASGDNQMLHATVEAIVAEERAKKNETLATKLTRALGAKGHLSPANRVSSLPTPGRELVFALYRMVWARMDCGEAAGFTAEPKPGGAYGSGHGRLCRPARIGSPWHRANPYGGRRSNRFWRSVRADPASAGFPEALSERPRRPDERLSREIFRGRRSVCQGLTTTARLKKWPAACTQGKRATWETPWQPN